MSELSQLVFYGEVLPGHDAEAVKAKLAELLKLPVEQIPAVFSGRKVVLRKNLPSEQGPSYLARLEKVGVKALIEPMPAAAPAMPPVSAPVAVETAMPLAVAEEMDCPKCGERQPKRTLCRACSVDMKRFSEAQQNLAQQAREDKMMAREIALAANSLGGKAELVSEDHVGILGLGFSGRLGRLSYLAGNLLYWAVIAIAIVIMISTGSVFIAVAIVLLVTIASLRLSVLRCHDIGWTGWLSLIFFIPYIGPLFGLVLLFMPGNKEDNNHGAPSPTPGFPVGLAVTALFVLSTVMLYKQQDAFFAYAAGQTREVAAARGGGGPVHSLADADVEMFTTSSCGVCHMAKAYMNKNGITYVEKDVEKNEDYLRDFYARGGRGVPYIFVGRQSMEGFDPQRLQDMLDSRS